MDRINNEFWNALDELVCNSDIVIDRPKGSAHPKYPHITYKVDYGYLNYSKEEFEDLVENDEVISVAAEVDERIVGICFVTMRNKSGMVPMRTAYMDDLVVDESYQRQGIAKALLEAVEKRAKELGAKRMDLMVWSFNEQAKSLYESFGMTPQRFIYEKEL